MFALKCDSGVGGWGVVGDDCSPGKISEMRLIQKSSGVESDGL